MTIHRLLDAHATAMRVAGSRFEVSSAPSRDEVIKLLTANDYAIREDVVEYFTWSRYPEEPWRSPELFWSLNPMSLEPAIAMHRLHQRNSLEFWLSEGYQFEEAMWFPPGPPFFLPIAVGDASEYISVDCRPGKKGGGLWIQHSHEPEVDFLFESFEEAIEAATWCVESGLWAIDEESRVTADRPFAARNKDRDSPPFSTEGLPPEISFAVNALDDGRVLHHRVLRGGEPLSWRDLLDTLTWDGYARLSLSAAITNAPFAQVFFETPALTRQNLDDRAEFVLVEAHLHANPDPSAFAEHLEIVGVGEIPVKTFQNLRGDATLIAPTPMADDANRNYLRSFLSTAPEMQIHSFWAQTAFSIQQRISDLPAWISTSGGGVPWLHLRLDDRPKYYTYRPYT